MCSRGSRRLGGLPETSPLLVGVAVDRCSSTFSPQLVAYVA